MVGGPVTGSAESDSWAGLSVAEILQCTGGRVANSAARGGPPSLEQVRVRRPSPLAGSRAEDLGFFFNPAYKEELPSALPGVLITGEDFVQPLETAGLPLWSRSVVIACRDPYLAMGLLSEKFAERLSSVAWVGGRGGDSEIDSTARVSARSRIGRGVRIGAHCVVEPDSRIGAGTVLYPGCYVGPGVEIGENCVLFPRVTIYEWARIGHRVRLHAGVVVGSDGFGYAPIRSGQGEDQGAVKGHQKIHHLGRVVIGDDVEIGANSCVDRGTFGETRIDQGAKLDNQVHVGHNAQVGEGAILCGGICLAGNARIGRFAYIGGMVGVVNQVVVGDGASVGALSLISRDVAPGAKVLGNPQREQSEHFRAHAALNRLIATRRHRTGRRDETQKKTEQEKQ